MCNIDIVHIKHRTAGNQYSHRCPRLEPVVSVPIKHQFCIPTFVHSHVLAALSILLATKEGVEKAYFS